MLWVGTGWRRGRTAMLGVVVLSGLAAAVVLMAAAGARRTASSLERLAGETGAVDVAVDVSGVDPAAVEEIAGLPVVAGSGAISVVFAIVDGVDQDIGLWIPHGDEGGVTVGRDLLVRGRRPTPDRRDEVVVNELTAEVADVDVGDELTVSTLTPEQIEAEDYSPARGPRLDLRVVGVTRGPGDLIAGGDAMIGASPALLGAVDGRVDVFATYLGVRLVSDATVADFESALRNDVPNGDALEYDTFDVQTKPARDAISTLAVGLMIFGAVAAVTSIFVVGLTIGRQLAGMAGDQEVLVALGMSRPARVGGLVLLAVPIAIGGAAIGVVGAVLASPLMPIGLARRAEPDPGISVDWLVLTVGFVAVAAAIIGSAALTGWRIVHTQRSSLPRPTAPSLPRVVAHRLGAGPSLATGVQLAFDRRPPVMPVWSALAGTTVTVLAVTAGLTFSSSLDRLIDSPVRWGHPWQLMLNFTSAEVDRAANEIAGDNTFSEVARWDSGLSYVNGDGARAFGLTPLHGEVDFSLRSGQQPAAADEIVLGPDTAKQLGVTIGDSVKVAADPTAESAAARVVGIALFPEIDDGDLTDGIGYLGPGFAAHATVPDLFEASQVVVTIAAGHDLDDVASRLNQRYPGSVTAESIPAPPGGVGNLIGVRRLPRWIAAFVVALGLVSMAHGLTTARRRRRRDLATLRSLGLRPRETISCIVWQALTIGVVGLVVGIPIGLIAGRAAWWAVADPIGVSADATRPVVGLIGVSIAVLICAALLAIPIGWQAGRAPPAQGLRAE
jgi:hypothetical protein